MVVEQFESLKIIIVLFFFIVEVKQSENSVLNLNPNVQKSTVNYPSEIILTL